MPDQHGRTLGKRTVAAVAIDAGPQGGAATEESVTIGNGLYLLGKIGGSGVSFLVDTGSGVSILAARQWKEWGRTEDELTRYWGRLCSVEGRALECLGKARLTVNVVKVDIQFMGNKFLPVIVFVCMFMLYLLFTTNTLSGRPGGYPDDNLRK